MWSGYPFSLRTANTKTGPHNILLILPLLVVNVCFVFLFHFSVNEVELKIAVWISDLLVKRPYISHKE